MDRDEDDNPDNIDADIILTMDEDGSIVGEWNEHPISHHNSQQDHHERQMMSYLASLLSLSTVRAEEICPNPERLTGDSDLLAQFDWLKFSEEILPIQDFDQLLAKLDDVWNEIVPCVYRWPQRSIANLCKIQREETSVLFNPLMAYFTGNLTFPNFGWNEIRKSHKRTVCGKMFKHDGILYQCWSCSSDPTTVLCSECFLNSEHKFHKYRMGCSFGGGFCDCGDVESWRAHPHCKLHAPDLDANEKQVSDGCRERIELVVRVLLFNAVNVLCCRDSITEWTEPEIANDSSDVKENTPLYACVISNDEAHSYDDVIACLKDALSTTDSEAYDIANRIDKEGRAIVNTGLPKRMLEMKKLIYLTTMSKGLDPLHTEVIRLDTLSHQEFAIETLQFIENSISDSDVIRLAVCKALTTEWSYQGECWKNHRSILERMLLTDDILWKAARAVSHKILVNSFLEYEGKLIFGSLFIKNYPKIMQRFLQARDENLSFAELSVQLFTTPSLAVHVLAYEDALFVLSTTFLDALKDHRDENLHPLTTRLDSRQTGLRKSYRVLVDIRYLFSALPKNVDMESLNAGLTRGLEPLLQIFLYSQGMNSYRRERRQHVTTEPEWETAFNLALRYISIIREFFQITSKSEKLTELMIRNVVQMLKHFPALAHTSRQYGYVKCLGHTSSVIQHDIMTQRVSVHYPLSRLLTGSLVNSLKFMNLKAVCDTIFDDEFPSCWLFEHALRLRVLMAQSGAGLWKRNGLSVVDQLMYITTSKCRSEMYDRDLMSLQLGASIMDPNVFIMHIINKFGLTQWMSENVVESYVSTDETYTFKQMTFMVEEFLELLIQILSERYHPSIGNSDFSTMVQREMVHILCCRTQTHNEIVKEVDTDDESETVEDFLQLCDEILAEIAIPSDPSSSKRTYSLKGEYLDLFNPYYSHYSRQERSEAEHSVMEIRKEKKMQPIVSIPLPPLFVPQLRNTMHVMDCDLMFQIIVLILRRSLDSTNHVIWSDGMMRKALHIVLFMIQEEKRDILTNDPRKGDGVKLIRNENPKIAKEIMELVFAVASSDSQALMPVKEICSEVLKQYYVLEQLKYEENIEKSIERYASNSELLTSLTFQQQRQLIEVERRKQRAKERKEKLMSKMNTMKRSFIQSNKELYENTIVNPDLSGIAAEDQDVEMTDEFKTPQTVPRCLGINATPLQFGSQMETCIFCQETQDVKASETTMGLLCYKQSSRLLKPLDPLSRDPDSVVYRGIHLNTCGHTIHFQCHSMLREASARTNWTNSLMINGGTRAFLCLDHEQGEIACPLCHSLSNVLLPFFSQNIDPSHNFCDPVQLEQELRPENMFAWLTKIDPNVDQSNMALEPLDDNCSEIQRDEDQMLVDKNPIFLRMMGTIATEDWTKAFSYTLWANLIQFDVTGKSPYNSLSQQTISMLEQMSALAVNHYVFLKQESIVDMLKKENARTFCEMDTFHRLLTMLSKYQKHKHAHVNSTLNRSLYRSPVVYRITRTMISAHILQTLRRLSTGDEELPGQSDTIENIPEVESIDRDQWLQFVRNKDETISELLENNPFRALRGKIMRKCLFFLRACALFYKVLLRIPFPDDLICCNLRTHEEFTALCNYLGMPTTLESLALYYPVNALKDMITPVPEMPSYFMQPQMSDLVDIPNEFLSLLSRAASVTSKPVLSEFDDDTDATKSVYLCLHCGQVVWSKVKNQNKFNESNKGCATAHMRECSGMTGMFIRIKECRVMMFQILSDVPTVKVRGAMHSAPYADEYGETDDGLKRGYPLYLNHRLLSKLRDIWLRQRIPHEASAFANQHRLAFTLAWENL